MLRLVVNFFQLLKKLREGIKKMMNPKENFNKADKNILSNRRLTCV